MFRMQNKIAGPSGDTYNAFSPGKIIEINLNINISVNVCSFQLDVFSSDLFCLDLDQPDPFLAETKRGILHLLVDVFEILGDGVVDHLKTSQ